MKEDYLWDGTGSDPEIEKLEASLGTLSYKGGVAPKVPVRRRASFLSMWRPPFGLSAGFAVACVAMICFGSLWMIRPKHSVVSVPDIIVDPKQPAIQPNEVVNPPEPPIAGPKSNGRPDVLTASYKPPKQAKVVKTVHKEKPIVVTGEEAAAYKELMLALSIASSNLRIVRDTVAGTGKESTVSKSDR